MSRSVKKGPFVAYKLLRKINTQNLVKHKEIIKTWSRSSTILPIMIGNTIAVHNGKQHIPIFINEHQVGHKLGEFVPTRIFRAHKKKDKKIKR